MTKDPLSPALNPQWKEMALPHYLKVLRVEIQKGWVADKTITKGDRDKFSAARKRLEKKGSVGNVSDAKKFLQNSVGVIVRLLRREEVGVEAGVLKDAYQVTNAIENEEELLKLIAPDFTINPSGRWPGPVSYRSALNHLIAVSIRVHSMYPETKFEDILFAAAKRILVPALAHNLTFLRRSDPMTFNLLLKSDTGIDRFQAERLIDKSTGGKLPEDQVDKAKRWIRLLNAAFRFAQTTFVDHCGLFAEIKRLTLEHEINPTGSALWNELSLIASGDLSIDELLVSRVTTDLQDKLGTAVPRPIVFCARARFGLLRYAYAMTEQRALVATDPCAALAAAKEFCCKLKAATDEGKRLEDDACIRAFGWAYLWSRHLLLGRADDKRMETPAFKATRDEAGQLLDDLLYQTYRYALKTEYRQLALRYVAGFLTNPRFIRPGKFLSNNQNKANTYVKEMRAESLPGGLITMMEARMELHRAFALQTKPGFSDALNKSLAAYADTLKSISASEHSDNMMDGEVAAWAIPEMRYAVELLKQTVTETGHVKKSKISELERIQKALDMVGEMQFGVYFNQEEEVGRLEKGLKLGCADLG